MQMVWCGSGSGPFGATRQQLPWGARYKYGEYTWLCIYTWPVKCVLLKAWEEIRIKSWICTLWCLFLQETCFLLTAFWSKAMTWRLTRALWPGSRIKSASLWRRTLCCCLVSAWHSIKKAKPVEKIFFSLSQQRCYVFCYVLLALKIYLLVINNWNVLSAIAKRYAFPVNTFKCYGPVIVY